jgi:hypothetical protein
VLRHEPGTKRLHGTLNYGLQLEQQQGLSRTGSISSFFPQAISAVRFQLFLDLVTRVYDLRQFICLSLLSRFVNLIGLVTLQR